MHRIGGLVLLALFLGAGGAMAQGNAAPADAAPADSAKADSGKADSSQAAAPPAKPLNISGFVTASYTYGIHHTGDILVGRFYDRFHDQFELNAAKLLVEKPVATDKIDAGARVDLLFGQNAAVVQSLGLNLGTNGDVTQAFATLNLPTGAGKYVQFKAGKMATLMGVEVIEDVVNPNLSVGNLFVYVENFTNTGFRLDVKPAAAIDLELAVINGWDVVRDNNTKKSFMGRVGFTPSPATTIGLLGYIGNEKAFDSTAGVTPPGNRYGGEVVISQKLGAKTTVYLQGDYGEEKDLPTVGTKAKWWGASLWLAFDVSPALTAALRGDYVDDKNGVRTSGLFGFPANTGQKFGSGTLTFNIKRWEHMLIRPEFRYDRSNLAVYDNPATPKKDLFSLALGASYLF
ncbi:MAG TPA: outer membrane beta-barrel protein [Gemmatimonadales bacterium]|nr:outer membrane beta-barrel protein [Gemmatimonadales bacterium]